VSLREAELARSHRAQRSHTKQVKRGKRRRKRSALEAPLPFLICEQQLQDSQILSFRQWCALNGFSERTGRRILSGPNPPIVTRLTDTRIGISVGNNRRWQESRAGTGPPGSGDRARHWREAQAREK
jgi:hypothetical protein